MILSAGPRSSMVALRLGLVAVLLLVEGPMLMVQCFSPQGFALTSLHHHRQREIKVLVLSSTTSTTSVRNVIVDNHENTAAATTTTSRGDNKELLVDETVMQIQQQENDGGRTGDQIFLTKEESKPIFRFGAGSADDDKEKIINAFGLWCTFVSIMTCAVWMMSMSLVDSMSKVNPNWDPNRELFDRTGKIWSKTWLSMIGSYPVISGEELYDGPCLYVANHASWLDIPVLCTVLSPVFKFIAKGELSKIPCIGHQLLGGKHILINRDDRRSQLKTFKDAINWLKKGIPIMAFPEGMRSRDGRLMQFKGGIFSMAVKAKVPIVPITLVNTHAVMPIYSLVPVQPGRGKIHVHVHKPINFEDRTEAELDELVRNAFLQTLPYHQHPVISSSRHAGGGSVSSHHHHHHHLTKHNNYNINNNNIIQQHHAKQSTIHQHTHHHSSHHHTSKLEADHHHHHHDQSSTSTHHTVSGIQVVEIPHFIETHSGDEHQHPDDGNHHRHPFFASPTSSNHDHAGISRTSKNPNNNKATTTTSTQS